jgi:hypothetical protein
MNMVKFGVITKVCKGYAFARVMDNAGTVTAKEVFLGYRQFVVVDESQAQPWLTDMIDEVTEPKNGDYVAFLYNIHPVHRGGATPAYKWGIISNHDSASSSEGYTGPLMETDSLESGPIDPEIDRLARSTCGQNGVRHHRPDENPAYSKPHRGVSNHTNPSQRHNRRRQYSENHQNGDNGQRKDAAAVYIVT